MFSLKLNHVTREARADICALSVRSTLEPSVKKSGLIWLLRIGSWLIVVWFYHGSLCGGFLIRGLGSWRALTRAYLPLTHFFYSSRYLCLFWLAFHFKYSVCMYMLSHDDMHRKTDGWYLEF